MKDFLIWLIKLYQTALSQEKGILRIVAPKSVCRFTPTCSEYTIEAIEKYGSFRGLFLGVARIFKCNPFSKGGRDPVV